MAGESLFVSTNALVDGASKCDDASASASTGAGILQGVSVDGGVFGDFEAAHDFHGVAREVHGHHVEKFAAHAGHLADLARKGLDAGEAFTATDQRSEASIDQQMRSGG